MEKFKKLLVGMKVFLRENIVYVLYVILTMIGLTILRKSTINILLLKAFIIDLGLVLLIGSFSFRMKQKNRFRYLFGINLFFTILEVINNVYYKFYNSFISISDLDAAGEASKVMGSIFEKVKVTDFLFLLIPIIYILIYEIFIKKIIIKKGEVKNKKTQLMFIIISFLFIGLAMITSDKSDFSRIAKMWNRQSVVERFGFVLYQGDDIVQTLIPKVSSLFGGKKAYKEFLEYFNDTERVKYDEENQYTNILKDKNIVFVHLESIESYLFDLEFNNIEVIPNTKKLADEGMNFTNFYPQISIGTSSDTEFSIATSLMPVRTGSVFVSYSDRTYITLQKLLKEQGYATYSMHGNELTMWNRDKMHPKLGYDYMYFEDSFNYGENDVINLGINDKLFFKQAIPLMENFEKEHEKYMGTVITLSNHSPYTFLDKYGDYSISTTYEECIDSKCEEKTTDYLEGTDIGNFVRSVHYADLALGEFINYIKESDYFNDTIFIFYGDHDAKFSEEEKNYLFNYDYKTGKVYKKGDSNYIEYDSYLHNLNKKTPLIIWTKNKDLKEIFNGEIDYPMGMIDVSPTLENMLGIKNEYALGHDIFNIKNDNVVVFPNGNFLTSNYYYDESKNNYRLLNDSSNKPSKEEIEKYKKQTETILDLSNNIIVHDLIKKVMN